MLKSFVLPALLTLAVGSACSSSSQTEPQNSNAAAPAPAAPAAAPEMMSKDIVDTAAGAGKFNTLIAALEAAELDQALRGEGPFTVFAPTDEAFAKLPEGTVEALLQDKQKLTQILTYHVVPGKVLAADVGSLTSARTLQGQSIAIDASRGVRVDDANVVATDVLAQNGVIHVIDTVLIPSN